MTRTKTTTTQTKPKAKLRKPPVIDRAGVSLGTYASSAAPIPLSPVPPPPTDAPAASGAGATDSSAATDPVNTAIPVMNAPPDVVVPAAPAGFVPVNAIDLRGYRPMQSELASVPDAVKELHAFPTWSAVFGITAEPAPQIAQRLEVATQWTALYAASRAWDAYAKSQEGVAWKDALESIAALKPAFALASTANPAMLNQYPSLGRLLGAQKVVAKRGVTTRAKAKKASAAAVAASSGGATSAPVAAAAPGASDTSGTSGRTVTVTG